MTPSQQLVSFYTILRKDVVRMFRIWIQTFLPSVVTSILYFLIFGAFIGSQIGMIGGVSYITFVVPGLIMLAVITNAYSNVAFTFFMSKFFGRNIDEILVSPTPPWVIISGYVAGGIVRGLLVGILVLLVSLFFTRVPIAHPMTVLSYFFLTSLIFSLGGLINGIYAKSIDGINIVPTFVLTPMIYLGGIFYSIAMLPELWRTLTYLNPVFYIINGFRYGFFGTADVRLSVATAILLAITAVLVALNWYFLRKGLGLKQ